MDAPEGSALRDRLDGMKVVDANGDLVGRVTDVTVAEGKLDRCQVTISDQAKRVFGVERDVAIIDAADIARVEGDLLRLAKAAAQVLPGAEGLPRSRDEGGSSTFPRKTR